MGTDKDAITNLLLLHLENKNIVVVNFVENIKLSDSIVSVINFSHCHMSYEIQIYDYNFIRIKSRNLPLKICDSITDARNTIDDVLRKIEYSVGFYEE
jgi:hypothetical protein